MAQHAPQRVDGFNYQDHTLLVVDDNPANLAIIVEYLSERGFQVVVARDGETALSLAKSERPDLVLLDVMLPGIDGFETCRRLMAEEQTRHIIVIFMTVLTETTRKVKAFELGAVDYVTKPLQEDELLARVTTHLRLKDLTENLEHRVESQTEALTLSNQQLHQKIAEGRAIEAALRDSEGRYRAVIENSNDGISIAEGGRFSFVNRKLLQTLGYADEAELLGKPIGSIIHEDDRARVTNYCRLRETGQPAPARYEAKGLTKDGKTVYFDVSATRITYQDRVAALGFYGDVTQHKELEARLQQAQKMEAIGTLAGGIAHDFNNILSVILGHAELAHLDVGLPPATYDHLAQITRASRRASELVQRILTFSRQKNLERRPVKVGPLVDEALEMLRASLPSTLAIESAVRDRESAILADSTQIHQVLMNLCTNAAHAMPQQDGVLNVVLDRVDIEPTHSSRLDPGPHLRLRVADNGHGMDRQTLNRIFDPYFSTKKPGEGTGLGLAVVHGIVASYHGEILVTSRAGEGSCFDVFFPVTRQQIGHAGDGPPISELPSGTERILVVDDEEMVVAIHEEMLRRLGYHVRATKSADEALRIFEDDPGQFDLVITDRTMPHLTGEALSERMIRLRPDIPIIVCTGYSEGDNRERADALGIRRYLMKPVVFEELAHIIREVIDAA